MARQASKRNNQGFTLVELLIVVAIIGVLSTVGIPTFRRMIAKSKKSEAKVGLGGLYTAEQAFLSEYGGYGNHLLKVGVQIDGSSTTNIYTIGFPTAACASVGAIQPTQASGVGTNINTVFPQYYTSGLTSVVGNVPGFATSNTVCATNSANLPRAADVYATVGIADSFLASATGAISPGIQANNGDITKYDVWSIDQTRNLINPQDGVQ